MGNSNVESVQRIYEAFGAGDVDTILSLLAADVDFASESESRIAPWHGQRSKAEVPGFFQAIAETIDVTDFTVQSLAANDTDVMAVIRFGFTVRSTGKSGTMNLHHWFSFRDGEVVLYRGSEDTALVAERFTP